MCVHLCINCLQRKKHKEAKSELQRKRFLLRQLLRKKRLLRSLRRKWCLQKEQFLLRNHFHLRKQFLRRKQVSPMKAINTTASNIDDLCTFQIVHLHVCSCYIMRKVQILASFSVRNWSVHFSHKCTSCVSQSLWNLYS